MIQFILNQNEICTSLPQSTLLLDFIRYNQHLTGTKIGCREGDCGACTILVGRLVSGEVIYSSATSCLMALGNAHGKHIVTIEGINLAGLNTIQQAFADEGATQCGFCTPGFIISLACFCLSNRSQSYQGAIDAMNGNICRCTGYKSIERAAKKIALLLEDRNNETGIEFAVRNNIVPSYFLEIKKRLMDIPIINIGRSKNNGLPKFLGGGTDLYVHQHDTMTDENIDFLFDDPAMNRIRQEGNICYIGGSVTVTDIEESNIFKEHFSELQKYINLISSTQIRNMATIAGNFSNASPIGDFTIFFLALDAKLVLSDRNVKREITLRNFFKGYKVLDKKKEEFIETVFFELPVRNDLFNFEKVSKRTYLDIASVNTAIYLKMNENIILSSGVSAGGVSPVPLFLARSSQFLAGKMISAELVNDLIQIAQQEISPISDVRGTAEYKRLLLAQLIKAHFIRLFPLLPLQKLVA